MNKLFALTGLSLAVLASSLLSFNTAHADTLFTGPFFNTYKDVNGVGDEADFLRIRQSDGTKVDTVEQCSGDVTLWMYVHNDQGSQNNGSNNDGVGVAKDTRVKVAIPTNTANNHTITGTISASNATPKSVSDTTTITCAGKAVKLEYVSTDPVFTTAPGGYTLQGDITSANGALLGYNGGVFPGCWEYRAWITLKVRIVPEQPKVQTLSCTNAVLTYVDRAKRTVSVTVNGSATNGASISSYSINFGDGTVVNQQTATHTYAKDGNFTIVTRVLGTLNGESTDVTSQGCTKVASFSTTTPPPEIPNTGAGGTAALFFGAVVAGIAAYRFWIIRRLS